MGEDWFIHGAVIFAVVVVIPMTVTLDLRVQGRSRIPYWIWPSIGALSALSFFLPEGALAALLCVPWIMLCGVAGLERLGRLGTLVARLPFLLPYGYLTFGAAWLIVSRYGGRPMGFPAVIVELTAVHFHYAGFAAPVIIALTRAHQSRARQTLLVALWLSLVASPLTAIGFVYSAKIGAVGAVTFMVALFIWSGVTFFVVIPPLATRESVLMGVAALSVLVSMTLAAVYAIGVALGESWIAIPTMARTHGVLNALGFSFCGAVAWLLASRRADVPGHISGRI